VEAHVAVKNDHLREVVLDARAWLRDRLATRQWRAAKVLWDNESHWNPLSGTPTTCFGIPQACPGRKMRSAIRPKRGARWDSIYDPFVQISWGRVYVRERYGGFVPALRFQKRHGWY
jgi:hypothetical protein